MDVEVSDTTEVDSSTSAGPIIRHTLNFSRDYLTPPLQNQFPSSV